MVLDRSNDQMTLFTNLRNVFWSCLHGLGIITLAYSSFDGFLFLWLSGNRMAFYQNLRCE